MSIGKLSQDKGVNRKKAGMLWFRPAKFCQTALNKQIYCKKRAEEQTGRRRRRNVTTDAEKPETLDKKRKTKGLKVPRSGVWLQVAVLAGLPPLTNWVAVQRFCMEY